MRSLPAQDQDKYHGNQAAAQVPGQFFRIHGGVRGFGERYKLDHCAVDATLYDHGSWNGYAYMAINLGKAENLYEVMGKRKPEPPGNCQDWPGSDSV